MADYMTDQATYDAMLASGAENSRYKRLMDQQKAQAEYMRGQSVPNNGQMVSGHYIPPSWSQSLNTLMNAVGSKYMDNKALDSGGKLDSSMQSQNKAVLEALMRNRAATAQRPQAQQAPVEQGMLPQLSPMDTYQMQQPIVPNWQRSPAEQEGYTPVNYFGGE